MNVSAQDITEAPRVGPWAYKRILYFSPDPARFQCFLADLAQVAAVRSDAELIEQRLRLGDLEIEFVGVADSRDAVVCSDLQRPQSLENLSHTLDRLGGDSFVGPFPWQLGRHRHQQPGRHPVLKV